MRHFDFDGMIEKRKYTRTKVTVRAMTDKTANQILDNGLEDLFRFSGAGIESIQFHETTVVAYKRPTHEDFANDRDLSIK